MEIEELILKHKDVIEVCVTSVPNSDDGERAVACVAKTPGSSLTEQEIKDLVASKFRNHVYITLKITFNYS